MRRRLNSGLGALNARTAGSKLFRFLRCFQVVLLTLALCSAVTLACGDKKDGVSNGGDSDGIPSGKTGSCSTAENCEAGATCNPSSSTCVSGVACVGHSECGKAAYCDLSAGKCARASTGSPCESKDNCASQDECTGGFCGCHGLDFSRVEPNVLLILDRSYSMNGEDGLMGNKYKWDIAVSAITGLVQAYSSEIRFGLALFPGQDLAAPTVENYCQSGRVFADVGSGSSTVLSNLGSARADGNTPTKQILEGLLDYSGLLDSSRPNYIVLVTDGKANCVEGHENDRPQREYVASADLANVVAKFHNRELSTKTYVIGFGEQADQDQLNAIANAGGTALDGDKKYFVAGNQSALEDAFSKISGKVTNCNFALKTIPADLSQVFVRGDKVLIPRSESNGWQYMSANNSIIISGEYCENLQGGVIRNLAVVYGCNGQIN